MRLVRWIGDPLPWADPYIGKRILEHRLPLDWVEKLMEFERHQRMAAIFGRSEWIIGPNDGFSRTYRFGPQQFLVWMEDADAEKLFGLELEKWQFIDVTDSPDRTDRAPLGKYGWMELIKTFARLGRDRKPLPQYR